VNLSIDGCIKVTLLNLGRRRLNSYGHGRRFNIEDGRCDQPAGLRNLEEIAAEVELSLPAVKAALYRGRQQPSSTQEVPSAQAADGLSAVLVRYASLFNAHDWDGVRALLAEEVQLDLVSRRRASGKQNVANYFTNYARLDGLRLRAGRLDRQEVLAVVAISQPDTPQYFIRIDHDDHKVTAIHDYRYASYVVRDAPFSFADAPV
jgi:hypothetical protein